MRNPFRRAHGVDPKQLIENAFARAAVAVKRAEYRGTVVQRAVQKEGLRIKTAGSMICSSLKAAVRSFPDIDKIPLIYRELADALVGRRRLLKALTFTNWTANQIKAAQMHALRALKRTRHTQDARGTRRVLYGKAASYVKKAKAELELLSSAAKALHKLPDIRDLPTIIIAGLPNVGKSSLLKALTGAAPEIQPYPFTTRGLMLGYAEIARQQVQFIDTPGLLDRPLSERNPIERTAIAALKHLASLIIYIFDVSETSAPLSAQISLYKELRRTFKIPLVLIANKVDIPGSLLPEQIKIKERILPISCETGQGIAGLKSLLAELIKKKMVS